MLFLQLRADPSVFCSCGACKRSDYYEADCAHEY